VQEIILNRKSTRAKKEQPAKKWLTGLQTMIKYQAKNGNDCPLNGSCHKSRGEGLARSITVHHTTKSHFYS